MTWGIPHFAANGKIVVEDDCSPFSRVMKIIKEEIFYEQHPSMFRNRPVEFLVTCLLCAVLIGFVIFFLWWINCKGTTLTVSSQRTRLRRGILSKSITEVWHQDVRNVQLKQTLFQRLFGVGMIGVSSAGQSDMEISVSGIPDPETVKSLIDNHRLQRVWFSARELTLIMRLVLANGDWPIRISPWLRQFFRQSDFRLRHGREVLQMGLFPKRWHFPRRPSSCLRCSFPSL